MPSDPHRGTHCLVNGCEQPAAFALYSAYDASLGDATGHPHVARYPMPMVTPCADHLAAAMQADQLDPGATPLYVVKVL